MFASPLSADSSDRTSLSFGSFIVILCGLSAVLSAVFFLHLEESLHLVPLMVVAAAGFIMYAFLPVRFRLPFLFALNITAIYVLLGAKEGSMLLLAALVFFLILNLKLSVRRRTLILLLSGIALALCRIKIFPLPSGDVWVPVLGGLFMFRSILFLHELRFAKKEVNIWLRINYFFMLPNLVFVIFPVVDYKTFVGNYYSKAAFQTYRKGILWMANGVLHLFVYRLIYYYLVPNPTEIQDIYGFLQFIVATYALIVRLAGIFHLSAGMICLFGFDLPPTFHHYFFADSFSDLWRRINIYWREFVMKVFYYPVYFKVKRLGTTKAIAISILITFVFNWLLHAYQWFWIRGSVLFTLQDVSFWAVFGIAVMLNSLYLARPNYKKQAQTKFQISSAVYLSCRVIGIFMFMAFIWSWWTTPSVDAWIARLAVWKTARPVDFLILSGAFVCLVATGIMIIYIRNAIQNRMDKNRSPASVYAISVAGIWAMTIIGIPSISMQIEKRFHANLDPVIHTRLNDADRENQFKGYYETMLADKNLLDNPLNELEEGKPREWQQLNTLGAMISTNDLVTKRLKPNFDVEFKGAHFHTNEFGLRDRDVKLNAGPNTLRMALLGGSIEMGSGVETEQTFENLVEDKLTAEQLFKPYQKVEIVNFAVPGTHLPQHLGRLDKIVPGFHPQVVIYTAHSHEIRRIRTALYRVYSDSLFLEYDYLKTFFKNLNLPAMVDEGTFTRTLRPLMIDFITWGLGHIKHTADSIGAVPVWMFVPSLDGDYTPEEDKQLAGIAAKLGFYILDLHDFNGNIPEEDIILRRWDRHPNAKGHALLAKKMYEEINQNPELVKKIKENYRSQ